MKALLGAGLAGTALILAGCGHGNDSNLAAAAASVNTAAPIANIAAPNQADWTQAIARTPEGGYRMGNPNAPVKLVEYGSITCPHCAHFSETSAPLRDRYVRSGQVSYEFRPLMIHPQDPAVFLLLGCGEPSAFFRLSDQLFATQEQWLGRLQNVPQDQLQQLTSMSPQAQNAALIRMMGLDQFFGQRGMPQARIAQCLANDQALQQLASVTQHASQDNVNYTPAFIINGQLQDQIGEWSELEPRLRAAMAH